MTVTELLAQLHATSSKDEAKWLAEACAPQLERLATRAG